MNSSIQAITVFCGSGAGNDPLYMSTASGFGKFLAEQKLELVYGGACIGLMGAVADGALSANGNVTGIIPEFLKLKEVVHTGLSELITVQTMHERKMLMHERCQGFVMLPGGIGTMEEFFEIFTWAQLGLHQKPIGILNIDNYYDSLLLFIDQMVEKEFLKPVHRQLILVDKNADSLLQKMKNFRAPESGKILSEDKI